MKHQYLDEQYQARILPTPLDYQRQLKSNYCLEIKEVGMNIMDPQHTLSPLTQYDLDCLIKVPDIEIDEEFVEWLKRLKQDANVQSNKAGYPVEMDENQF